MQPLMCICVSRNKGFLKDLMAWFEFDVQIVRILLLPSKMYLCYDDTSGRDSHTC